MRLADRRISSSQTFEASARHIPNTLENRGMVRMKRCPTLGETRSAFELEIFPDLLKTANYKNIGVLISRR